MITTEEDQIDEAKSRRDAEDYMTKLTEEALAGQGAEEIDDEKGEEPPPAAPEPGKEEPEGGKGVETPSKAGEAAATPPGDPDPKPPEGGEPVVTPDPLENDEVIKRINSVNLRPGAHHKTEKALKVVKEIARSQRSEKLGLEKANKDLIDEMAKIKALKLLDETTEKELTDLRSFKRTVDRKHDPEFNKKYVEGEKNLETQSVQVLQRNAVPPSTIKYIEERGGILKFAVSTQSMGEINDVHGNPIARHANGTPYTYAEFFEKDVLAHMPPKDRQILQGLSNRAINLELDRDQELVQSEQESEALLKGREEKEVARRKDWGEKFATATQEVLTEFGDEAKRRTVPASATAEEKAEIDKHNATIDRAEGIAKRYANEWTPQNVARMVGTLAYHETAFKDKTAAMVKEIAELKKAVADKDDKLNKFKNSGKVSGTVPTAKSTTAPKSEDPETYMQRMQDEYLAKAR